MFSLLSFHSNISPLHNTQRRRSFNTPPLILSPLFPFHHTHSPISSFSSSSTFPAKPISSNISTKHLRAATQQKYVYPDPIPEFAEAETRKFRVELLKKLSKDKETFGKDIDTVVKICAEILSDFLHKEYGGPGTLLVEPFTDMLLALKEKKLPGAPVAARAALLWAQNYVDQDWDTWTSQPPK
ncbi:protein PLASTID REDOX INSENSITIVE 2, chloroplastic-like [Tasmannia lanceolata]|uniref:protein PLASTID REDOX INSENSITIVE 2, chloroplastic-like n=1 Tax=Tasmannia lanceolata TaxID=3420 RepID=UPI00406303E3